ncbi:hypothetical protein M3P05_09995 [Sansalvadorimonas sp. 2012CJ34-2]|uniref:Uncharacterized protein n=1 Tax=Parendozoicomonas callyspongiae TaxID=2942213 RepID=A0ABT0PFT7_9GAMM|nr:hypothetical protein [Sansalvadorimonas sp. 2012CJ34-2]MCL6270252.1 hypothetical protein [Sansalvadorimonas sp. 2012CJ34-2]
MSVSDLIEGFKPRTPWHDMRKILRLSGVDAGNGYLKTAEKHSKSSPDKITKKRVVKSLSDAYKQHLLYGQKAVQIYKLKTGKVGELATQIAGVKPKKSSFSKSYPLPLSEEKLKSITKEETVLMDVLQDGTQVVFSGKRSVNEKTSLTKAELTDDALDALGDVVDIQVYCKRGMQFFDVVALYPSRDEIELRIDIGYGMRRQDRVNAFRELRKAFHQLIDSEFNHPPVLGTAVDFRCVIDSFYRDEKNQSGARVCELGFVTTENSVKRESMRQKDLDLREELYHSAGREKLKEEVGDIKPFLLAMTWDVPITKEVSTTPELMLPGNSRHQMKSTERLTEVIISHCCGQKDYSFVQQRIRNYLSNEQ